MTPSMWWMLRVVLALLLFAWMSRQVRKPGGLLGRRLVRAMNLSHAALTDWGLEQLALLNADAILDIGCGGGRMVHRLAALAPGGKVTGLDYSEASVAASRDFNAKEIEAGQVRIELGSVAALPFADRTFDIVRHNRRNLSGRAAPPALWHRNAAARCCVPQRRGALRSSDAGGILRGQDPPRIRKKLDLRHGPQAIVAALYLLALRSSRGAGSLFPCQSRRPRLSAATDPTFPWSMR